MDVVFYRYGKLYVEDLAKQKMISATDADTNAEVEHARKAYDLIHNACYPSYKEAVY
jgi:hypothetical protein